MTFPAAPLDLRVELNLNGTWTDITAGDYVYQRNGAVQITRGRPDESPTPVPPSAQIELNNRDGRFSPKNPNGAYYGSIGRNTPLRISVPAQTNYMRLESDTTSSATTPDAVALHITGDIDIRLDLQLTSTMSQNTSVSSGVDSPILCGKWGASGSFGWLIQLDLDGTLTFWWSTTGSDFPNAQSTVPVPLTSSGRTVIRVTMSVATGTVTFYTAAAGNADTGPFTQLGSAVVHGSTSIFANTTAVSVGNYPPVVTPVRGMLGNVYEFELRSGIAGSVKAHPIFSAQTAGTTSFADAQSNTWTLNGTAEISNRSYRGHFEVPTWPPQWDPSGTDVYTQIQAAGVLRRLSQGSKPFDSPLKRAYLLLTGTQKPVAYWPCEDVTGSTQLASAIGGPAIQISGSTIVANDSNFACSNPIPTFGAGVWKGTVPTYTAPATPVNMVQFLLDVPSAGTANNAVITRMLTSGTVAQLDVIYTTGGALTLTGFDNTGAQLFTSGPVSFGLNGTQARVSMALVKNGTGADWHMDVQIVNGSQTGSSGTQASTTVGNITQVIVNPNAAALTGTGVGHISAQTFYSTVANLSGALNAWAGETAGTRYARLCFEQGIACRITGYPAASAAMGVQTQKPFLQLLQECEDADRGLQSDPRTTLGLAYRTLGGLCDLGRAATMDYSSAQLAPPLTPVDDDQFVKNDVTVTRSGGSSSRQVLTGGALYAGTALSTQAPPNGVGTYDTALTVNVQSDTQLDNVASWILSVLTSDEPRYPAITVNMARTEIGTGTAEYYAVQEATDIGDHVEATTTPAWLPPPPVRQLVAGVAEQLGGYVYQITFQGIPETPYEVAISDDPAAVHNTADTDGSTVHANISSAAVYMAVDTTTSTSPLWTTSASDLPFDIIVSGERMTATVISAAGNFLPGQTANFDGGIGTWVAVGNCTVASVGSPVHGGTGAMSVTSVAAGTMNAAHATNSGASTANMMPCVSGDSVTASAWFQAATVLRACQAGIQFYTAAGALISSSFSGFTNDAVGSWTQVSQTATAPATTAFARAVVQVNATGGAGEIHYIDDAILRDTTTMGAASQVFTVTRSVNGITKAQTAGTDVRLFFPPIAALN